jgi:tRNA nucleotidyltransferase/poly(A) polymerase
MVEVAKIDPELLDHVVDTHTRTVMALLDDYQIHWRVVGGAVRNLLLGQIPRDIDLVADADPSELIYILEHESIPVDLGGIEHGTVKAVFGHGAQEQKVDVSSLGYRIRNLGSRLHVHKAKNWREDAQMRDLTINSLSMDRDGTIHDYLGGYEDLHDQIVRLAPQAHKGLTHNPEGIMRYMRALVLFPDAQIVQKDLDLIQDLVPQLAPVADSKKVTMNLITILKSEHRQRVLDLMCELNINKYVPSVPCGTQENSR